MKGLQIFQRADHVQVVSAKKLYQELGLSKTHWAAWYKINITGNKFAIQDMDYTTLAINANGNETRDFAITLDFAKRLCMLTRTEKGESIRRYFIDCERRLYTDVYQEDLYPSRPQFEGMDAWAEALEGERVLRTRPYKRKQYVVLPDSMRDDIGEKKYLKIKGVMYPVAFFA